MTKDFWLGKLVFGGLALSLLLAIVVMARAITEPSWLSISAGVVSVGIAMLSYIGARRWWMTF